LLRLSNLSETQFRQISRIYRDAGLTTTEALQGVTCPAAVTLAAIAAFFDQLATVRGPEAKIALLEKQFRSLSPLASGYVVRILTGDLRIGLKEGLIEESIADAFGCSAEAVREAHMLTGDLGQTALLARQGRIAEATLAPLRPIKCMLATPEPDASSVWRRFTMQCQKGSHRPESECEHLKPCVWIEDKFDGIRAQLHRVRGKVEIFSRDLKPITDQFQEIAHTAASLADEAVLDGEIIAYEEGRKLTFFDLQKRLGRMQNDLFLPSEIPVVYVVFDILWLNGESLLHLPLSERRIQLEALRLPRGIRTAARREVRSPGEIDLVFAEVRNRGNEGLMIKDPSSPYTPGRRGHSWLKLKKEYATLDVVVTAVEQGHGRRSGVLSDYTFAVRDENGALRNIGKAYSGLTDVEIAELTEHFEAHGVERKGGWLRVEPNVVIEVAFDSIQPSPRYDSGLALRFPRIKAIRKDKTVLDIDTLATAKSLVS
jgi:DNA ligase-1